MPRDNVVIDNNNIPLAILGIRSALEDGMEEVFNDTMSTAMSNWSSGTDALGNSWARLSDETIRRKGGGDILVESGELKSDVQSTSRYESDSNTAIFSSSLEYAGVHEFGLPERGIPPRPFLVPMAQYAAKNLDIVEKELDDQLDDARVR